MIHCLHGAVGSFRDWEFFKAGSDQQLNALDLWKFLKNEPPSLAQAGAIIANQANTNDIILGYSMGGRLALHALLAAPKKWKAAIIVSAHPGLIEGHDDRIEQDSRWAALANRNWEFFLKKWNQQGILPPNNQGLHQATLINQDAVAKSFHHWSLGTQKNLRTQLATLPCPVLWMTGEKDQKFTEFGREAASLLPKGHHAIIADSGHRVPWEKSESFSSTVRKFLSNI
jgi:2-succinyl-6-hydroxy-2,4-cyclohexadiene-1-carboxylate synthase